MTKMRKKLIVGSAALATLLCFKWVILAGAAISVVAAVWAVLRIQALLAGNSQHYYDRCYWAEDPYSFRETLASAYTDDDDWVLNYYVTGIFRGPGDSMFR